MKTRKEGGVSCLENVPLIYGLRLTLVFTLHNVSAHCWWAPVPVWGHPLGSSIRAGQIASVLNFWTTAFWARLQRNTEDSRGRSFWPLIGLTRMMLLKHLCFHFLFWFKCLRKRIRLLGSWIPNIKHINTLSLFEYLNRAGLFLSIIKAVHFQPVLFKFNSSFPVFKNYSSFSLHKECSD